MHLLANNSQTANFKYIVLLLDAHCVYIAITAGALSLTL